jgi:hypothetical protein
LVDANGRIAMQQKVNYSGGSAAIAISLNKIGRGHYKFQVLNSLGSLVATEAILKN